MQTSLCNDKMDGDLIMPHVASTMSSDTHYSDWTSNPGGINVKKEITGKKQVTVHGGHGVAKLHKNGARITPEGVITEVTEAELAFLQKDEVFQTHLKHGFVKILSNAASKAAPEKIAKDMAGADASAPLTDKDFKKGGRAATPEGAKIKEGKEVR